jgi:hypothetical protein
MTKYICLDYHYISSECKKNFRNIDFSYLCGMDYSMVPRGAMADIQPSAVSRQSSGYSVPALRPLVRMEGGIGSMGGRPCRMGMADGAVYDLRAPASGRYMGSERMV